MSSGGLFDDEFEESEASVDSQPLAERMRPVDFEDIVGQDELIAKGSLLRDLIDQDHVPSMILWGPPGVGKTTIARVISKRTGLKFVAFSAVLSGVKQVREVVAEARYQRQAEGIGTILFVDEIHRFNKSQQDAFLPHVEDGTIVLIGATTENPSFALNAALLSRCQLFTLAPLNANSIEALIRRALAEPTRHDLPEGVSLTDGAIESLVKRSAKDARSSLNALEALLMREEARGHLGKKLLDAAYVERALNEGRLRYDRSGEDHFNVMSAFHKSMRGGDPQASLYWMVRMLNAGEDPLWVARRIIRFASEDVGLADPNALTFALAARESFHVMGSPEGELALAQAAVYMATAPKSNAIYAAYNAVKKDIKSGEVFEVPHYLRNAPTAHMKEIGYGQGYKYPHDFDEAVVDQDYLPSEKKGTIYFDPSPFGYEKDISVRMDWWKQQREKVRWQKPKKSN
ncbi:MAG: putative ATPase [Planctomycetota bacterium]|jgi:putative ATPase